MRLPKIRAEQLFGWNAPTEEIRSQLVEHRHGATRNTVILANILVASLVVAALWKSKPHMLLAGWLAAITVVALLLLWSMDYYIKHRSDHSACHWAFRFTAGGFLNGSVWGLGAFLLFDPATPNTNVLMIGVICGMTAGASITAFAIPVSAYAYLVPAILLSMYMPLTRGSSVDHELALLWAPYFVVMVILIRSAHKALAQSVRLRFENAHLAESLAIEKERAEQLAQAKASFLAVMSHEIRTPMHGMLGIAELLSNTHLDAKQKMYLEHLRGAGEYLSQLLNNILDYSKIDAEKLVLHEAPFSLSELVGDVAGLFSLQAAKKRLLLDVVFPDNVAQFWRGDAHRLKQVLINLLGNAFKFTDTGTIRLEVAIASEEAGSTRFTFRVSDTGPGISPAVIATIFEPFTQEHLSDSREYAGTGLGLAISKRLVEAMGGVLTLESHVGAGSAFTFTIPLAVANATEFAAGVPQVYESASLPPGRVLIADDAPLNRMVLREFLRGTSLVIDEVEDGQQAVDAFERNPYDVVLMDMRMPVMDGLDAVRRIRIMEAQQQRGHALIYMLTASAFDSDRIAVMAAGCDALLTKPLQKETLIRLLRNRVERESGAAAVIG